MIVRALAAFGAITLAWGIYVWVKVNFERKAAR